LFLPYHRKKVEICLIFVSQKLIPHKTDSVTSVIFDPRLVNSAEILILDDSLKFGIDSVSAEGTSLSISSPNNSRIVDLIELPPVAVHPVLHPALVVEELGGGQDHGAHDGPGRGGRLRGNSRLVQLCMAFFLLKKN
jgi:hypothetical protein